MPAEALITKSAGLKVGRVPEETLLISLSGDWRLHRGFAADQSVRDELSIAPKPRLVVFESDALGMWDSSLLVVLTRIVDLCRKADIKIDFSGLPRGLRRLIDLAQAVPGKESERSSQRPNLVARVGLSTIKYASATVEFLGFLGEVCIAIGRFVTGKARFRPGDLMLALQDCGASAFGIVTLISFLVGTILAFMGAVALEQFGASIYVADLVAIGMTRDMGAMMTAIIMAGRTGAAFAAQLGTMKVTQEIDALATMGISPMEFLVLPRVIALVLMMPLLCFYSDLLGILGGSAVGTGLLGVSFATYIRETIHALTLGDILGGAFKAGVYGVIVAVTGCLRGFQCGSSSSAVGDAATSAVVTGIVYIVVACGVFALVFNRLGF